MFARAVGLLLSRLDCKALLLTPRYHINVGACPVSRLQSVSASPNWGKVQVASKGQQDSQDGSNLPTGSKLSQWVVLVQLARRLAAQPAEQLAGQLAGQLPWELSAAQQVVGHKLAVHKPLAAARLQAGHTP